MPPCVYFIQRPNGWIKLGWSSQLRLRLGKITSELGEDLRLLGTLPGGYALEQELHHRFKGCRQSNEWFRPSRRLLRFITVHSLPPRHESVRRWREEERWTSS